MKAGKLTFGHMGARVTVAGKDGGSITGKLSSMAFIWPDLHMGKIIEVRGLKLTVAGWEVLVDADETDVEILDMSSAISKPLKRASETATELLDLDDAGGH